MQIGITATPARGWQVAAGYGRSFRRAAFAGTDERIPANSAFVSVGRSF